MTEILVLDVSQANATGQAPGRASLQDDLDWGWAAAHGVRGAYVEGYVGNDGPNPSAATQMADIRASGISGGWYDFLYPGLPDGLGRPLYRGAAAQARLHAAMPVDGQARVWLPGDMPHAYDAEWPVESDFAKWTTSWGAISTWLLAYIQERSLLSGQARHAFYSFHSWVATLIARTAFVLPPEAQLWIAGDVEWTVPGFTPTLWQRTGRELMVPTKSGRGSVKCDCSVFLGDETAWATFRGLPPSDTPTRPDLAS